MLRARGMVALIDVHALPCNSGCVSDGIDCANPLAFDPDATVGAIERCTGECATEGGRRRCDGRTYATTRRATGAAGATSASRASRRSPRGSALCPRRRPAAVAGLQLANEPALNTDGYDAAVKAYYRAAVERARAHLPQLPLYMSFIPPNDGAVPAFVGEVKAAGGGAIVIDHHWYLNWAASLAPSSAGGRCTAARATRRRRRGRRTRAGVPLVLGEWSLATNHDEPLDLRDAATRAELRRLYRERARRLVLVVAERRRRLLLDRLRMGSGWDPRHATDAAPDGGTGWHQPAAQPPGYPYTVWRRREMAREDIIEAMDAESGSARATACRTKVAVGTLLKFKTHRYLSSVFSS